MQVDTQQGIKLFGFYRGVVKQHLSDGYCKIWIPGVYDESYNDYDKCELLPNAEQASLIFGGCTQGNGMFSYPDVGSVVWCFFQNGDQNYPVYFATTYGGDFVVDNPSGGFASVRMGSGTDDDGKDVTKTGYDAQNHLIRSGNVDIMIKESGNVEITTNDSDADGNIENRASITINGESGSISIRSTEDIFLDAKRIHLKADEMLQVQTNETDMNSISQMKVSTNITDLKSYDKVNVQSRDINLDASTGVCKVIGKTYGMQLFAT